MAQRKEPHAEEPRQGRLEARRAAIQRPLLPRQHDLAGDLRAARGHEVEPEVGGEVLRTGGRTRQASVLGRLLRHGAETGGAPRLDKLLKYGVTTGGTASQKEKK